LQDQLHLTLARSDLALVAQAIDAWRDRNLDRVLSLNDWVLHTRESSELRLQTEQMGRSMMDWLRNQHTGDASNAADTAADAEVTAMSRLCPLPTYPIAFALAASLTQAPVSDCLSSYAFGWAENMVQAAVKAVPLGQNAGQRILADLAGQISAAVADALARDDDTRQVFAPMLAILSAQHETQYSRLFRS
jgi:urease accessory protein